MATHRLTLQFESNEETGRVTCRNLQTGREQDGVDRRDAFEALATDMFDDTNDEFDGELEDVTANPAVETADEPNAPTQESGASCSENAADTKSEEAQ